MYRAATAVIVITLLAVVPAAQQRDRGSVPEKYKWDLTHSYSSNAAWRTAKEQLEKEEASVDTTTDQPLELTLGKVNR